jgi:hypothetical protein
VETTEYQSRIEGLNGTALVLPPRPIGEASNQWWCIGLAVVNLEIPGHV